MISSFSSFLPWGLHMSLKVLLKVSPESNEDNLLMDVLFDFYPKAKKDIID